MSAGEAAAARALDAVGTRFRLHGRDGDGLDCVGLAGRAWGVAVPTGYALRGGEVATIARVARAAGLRAGAGDRIGDLIVLATGPGQLHLAIRTARGVVHADAALRRVVERPGMPPWPELGRWRGED
ncbi:peptidoglycan endopeptidase [Sphingomonas sp.]|uniref:peptidoglycan endopeptidase n=1 Tax=Sphingomonas sp. TaxID=28214 RepID=UPI002DD66FD1|nr:peptidoglycan endopeptidase [Sphingomonas sp.]